MRTIEARSSRGFTLIELLVVMVIIAILCGLIQVVLRKVMSSASEAQSIQQSRQIIAAIIARTNDMGTFYSAEEIGYSGYRSVTDPLGLPQILKGGGYLQQPKVWWVRGTRSLLEEFGNSFAWNRSSSSLCGKAPGAIANPSTIQVLYSNYSFTMPSVENVPEATTGGPRNAPNAYWEYPFRAGTANHQAFADGHVELVYKPGAK